MSARPVRPWAIVALVGAAALLAYAPSLIVPFQFDDYSRIAYNAPLQRGEWRAALPWLGSSRVLPSLTIIANYVLGGERVLGYHVVNLALHLGAVLGVFVLARLLCRGPRLRESAAARRPLVVAGVAALVMACHPLQTQAVTYIIQRAAVMSALFYVWAVACYARGRLAQVGRADGPAARWFVATALLGICAVLSKENAVSLPLALLLTELVAIGGRPRPRTLAAGAAMGAALLVIPALWKVANWRSQPIDGVPLSWLSSAWMAILAQGTAPPAVTPYSYFLTQLTVIPAYLRLIALPWGLTIDHDVPLATAPTAPVLLGLALLVALCAVGVLAARRAPLVGFGILWIFVALSVESSVLPITDLMVEHRVYLAMPGVGLIAGAALARLRARRPRTAMAAVGVLAALLVALTFARNLVWQSPVSLWLDAVEQAPGKGRALVNYGVALHGAGRLDAAMRQYCRALAIDPDLSLAQENLELALDQQGRLEELTARLARWRPPRGKDPGGVLLQIDIPGAYCAGIDLGGG